MWWGFQPHAPTSFTARNVPGTHFHWGLSRPPGPWYGRKEYVTEKPSDTIGNRSRVLTITLHQAPTWDGVSHDKLSVSVLLHLVLPEVRVLYPIWLFYVATGCRPFLVCCSGIFWKIFIFLHLLIIIITVIHIFVRMTRSVSWIGFDLDDYIIRISWPVVVRKKLPFHSFQTGHTPNRISTGSFISRDKAAEEWSW